MPKVTMTFEQKRPRDATPARALELFENGVQVSEIARMWNIGRTRVYQLAEKARIAREKAGALAPNTTPGRSGQSP
mgnify:CR=1 FL=1